MHTWPAVHALCLVLRTFLMLSPVAALLCVPVASGAPPTVDAGPNKILALPAKDLTLLGYATEPENNPLTVLWTLASGPAAVSFSAPTALTTTVTFTATVTDSVVVDGAEQIHPVPQWQAINSTAIPFDST